ncbi:hypothetical protein AB3N58_10935 [Leptospira sp. WS60.C2]
MVVLVFGGKWEWCLVSNRIGCYVDVMPMFLFLFQSTSDLSERAYPREKPLPQEEGDKFTKCI